MEYKHPSMKAARQHSSNKERLPDGRFSCAECDGAIKHGTLGGYTNWRCRCRPCTDGSLEERREYMDARKAFTTKYLADRYQEFRKWYNGLKVGYSCVDCGLECHTGNTVVFDWDHRPDEIKEFNISSATRRIRNKERLLAEIAKCDLRCANCHRLKTTERLDIE